MDLSLCCVIVQKLDFDIIYDIHNTKWISKIQYIFLFLFFINYSFFTQNILDVCILKFKCTNYVTMFEKHFEKNSAQYILNESIRSNKLHK